MANISKGTFNTTKVISLRHLGPYGEVNDTWARLTNYATANGLIGPDSQAIGIVYDDPTVTPPDRIRYDACLSVREDAARRAAATTPSDDTPTGYRVETLNGGPSLVTVHEGTYVTTCRVYEEVLASPEAGSAAAPPYFEIYRNNPLITKPEELITEIHFLTR